MAETLDNSLNYQCPNEDCGNVQLYNEEEIERLKHPKHCPICDTKLESFSLWQPDEIEDVEIIEEEEFDPEDDLEDIDTDSGD